MYLSILGKPNDKDLERYPAVHLTGPHEWDPSVLDYTHPSGDGEPPWSNDPDERSIPHVEAVLASLVVESLSNCKFSIVSDFCSIVDLCFHPSRVLARSLESFTPSTWTYFCY